MLLMSFLGVRVLHFPVATQSGSRVEAVKCADCTATNKTT